MPLPAIHVPDDPADRRRAVRRTSRVLVLDEAGHVLLFRDSDLGLDPVPHWWMTPGGGLDPGESDLEAAMRELREETGLALPGRAFVGPVASRRVVHGYSDIVVDQVEVFFGARVARFTPDTSGHTEEELACIVEHGWFSLAQLEAGLDEPVWPGTLAAILRHLDRMTGDPALEPLALPDTEESTVPAGPGG